MHFLRGNRGSPVGLDSQVDPGVLRQVAGVGEALVALRALVRLGLSHVDLSVQLQVSLGAEDLEEEGEHVRVETSYSKANPLQGEGGGGERGRAESQPPLKVCPLLYLQRAKNIA